MQSEDATDSDCGQMHTRAVSGSSSFAVAETCPSFDLAGYALSIELRFHLTRAAAKFLRRTSKDPTPCSTELVLYAHGVISRKPPCGTGVHVWREIALCQDRISAADVAGH